MARINAVLREYHNYFYCMTGKVSVYDTAATRPLRPAWAMTTQR
jgi:hypothetical protein